MSTLIPKNVTISYKHYVSIYELIKHHNFYGEFDPGSG